MKAVTFNVSELFRGELVAGLKVEDWLSLSEVEKLTQRLAFIQGRADALSRMTYTGESGLPANIIAKAGHLAVTGRKALDALEAGNHIEVAGYALEVGKQMEALNKWMAVHAGVRIVLNLREGNSRGGSRPKRRPWAERAAELVESWDDLPAHGHALEFEDLSVRVYRDGDDLVAADIDDLDVKPKTIKRSTFERHYLRRSPDSK